MRKAWLLATLFILGILVAGVTNGAPQRANTERQEASTERLTEQRSSYPETIRPIEAQQRVTAYTLPPDLYRKSKTLGRIHFTMNLVDFFYGIFVFWLVLQLRLAPRFRDWAERVSKKRFVQAFVFTPALILTVAALESPTAIYEHIVSRTYGLSVQGWGALAWDWTKGILLLMLIGSFLVWILYGVIRRSPRRWWFDFWLIAVPIIVFLSFVEPYVLEPMFFTFAPLQEKDAPLVMELEKVVTRAGLDIAPERMFWMKASDKTPTMNAYVSGLGASKRIVVWDTTHRQGNDATDRGGAGARNGPLRSGTRVERADFYAGGFAGDALPGVSVHRMDACAMGRKLGRARVGRLGVVARAAVALFDF